MGRRKISIKQIDDTKLRNITFNKRKNGLIKKAAELSMLCNVNMLLVFEDGYGNLIQFSRDKIKNIAAFFKDCKYNNVIEVSSKDYPDFSAVAQFRKLRDRSDASLVVKKHGTRTRKLAEDENLEESSEAIDFDSTSADSTIKEEIPSDQVTPKSDASNLSTPTSSTLAQKLMSHSGQNKPKNKLGLKLRIPEDKPAKNEEKNKVAQPQSNPVFEESEAVVEKPALSPGQFQPELCPDNSPFGLFGNPRLSGNTIPSAESLGTRLQGYSYGFPSNGNMNMNFQGNNLGEIEERLDSAKMNAFLNAGQMNDQQCFNFELEKIYQEDFKTNQFNLMAAELPMFRPNTSMEGSSSFYDVNFGNYVNDGMDYRNYYSRVEIMGAPRKVLKQDQ